jgi:phosphotransferase system HPr-like phosphotransfer protein
MGLASYKIFGVPGAWHVDHDGKAANTYQTKEAAFEAAVAAASLALRQGHEVSVTAPGSSGTEATTGARDVR